MTALGNILKKEIRELLTPATFLPIIIVAFLFGTMGSSLQGIQEEAKQPPIIGVITADSGVFAQTATAIFSQYANVTFTGSSLAEKEIGFTVLKENHGAALIYIPENFTSNILLGQPGYVEIFWVMQGTGIMDAIPSAAVGFLIQKIDMNISQTLIQQNSSMNASVVLAPTQRFETTYFKGKEFTGISPDTIISLLSSQSMLIPIVIMMIIIMAGGIVITSMALEKENKTLETLLTLPVKRTSIVTGKLIASAVIGLLLSIIYMIGMSYYFQGFSMSQEGNLAMFGLTLSIPDFLLIGVSMFVALIAGLALCMLLGTFAKNYKSAQTLTFPITMFAMIPMFIAMFADFDTLPLLLKVFVFAIPFSHPMLAPRALLFDDYLLVVGGIVYVLMFALITIGIVVWIFKTDRLLTGSLRKKKTKGFMFVNRRSF
ncbi:MAG: ABC transporter permease [Candidatus Thermoplasmatota archaeon]